MSTLVTIREMAKRKGISSKTLRRIIKQNQIPYERIGRQIRLDPVQFMIDIGDASPMRPREPELFTYLIWAERTRNYKIGMTRDPFKRLRQLSTGCPYQLKLIAAIPYRLKPECELHEKYANHKQRGEWFYFPKTQDILIEFEPWTADFFAAYQGGGQ